MKLLLDQEVAEILRCSADKVKRLRLSGELPYIPGRPVKIDEADLLKFIEASKRRDEAKAKGSTAKPKVTADAWARMALLKPKRAPRTKPTGS